MNEPIWARPAPWWLPRAFHARPGLLTPAAHVKRTYLRHPEADRLHTDEDELLDDLHTWWVTFNSLDDSLEPFDRERERGLIRRQDCCQGCVEIHRIELEWYPLQAAYTVTESDLWPCARALGSDVEPFSALVDVVRAADAEEDERAADDFRNPTVEPSP